MWEQTLQFINAQQYSDCAITLIKIILLNFTVRDPGREDEITMFHQRMASCKINLIFSSW